MTLPGFGVCETVGCWKVKWLTASGKCERCEAAAKAASSPHLTVVKS